MSCGRPFEPIQTERRERRVVSVLFADLVGYTSRAEALDVEDVEGFLEPYHRLLADEVERLGGVVAKFTGDGVMAVFGVPTAHEDDPERAVRCAVSIRDRLADHETGSGRLHVRVGVATGEVLVSLGDEGRVDAIGDVVNTAARLESAAPADGVLVDEWTYRATDRTIAYEEGESVAVKGKSTSVGVWRAIHNRSDRPEQVRDDDVLLVGREDELRQLLAVYDRACREAAPQMITVVGPPGIGKSRLLREFANHVDGTDRQRPRRLHGRSLAYGEGVAFWALSEMVRGEAAISDDDSAEARATKLEETVERVVDADGNREWVARHLRPLVGLETAEELRAQGRVEAFAAWREFLEALGDEQPTILEFEDAHWADDALLDFVDALAGTAAAVPLIVLCTARPELLERRPAWGGGKVNATTLLVAPLSDDETTRLVEALAGEIALPAEASNSLLAHAGGNPLYAHEYVRMLRDRGFLRQADGAWHLVEEPTDLPESVYGIIAARLDTLTDVEKQLVQDASVIGRIGWTGAVAQLTGFDRWQIEGLLHSLERKQVLRRARHSRIRGDIEFAFGHALIRDVAYRQIRRADRAAKHLSAAEWTDQQGRDDLAEILAYHYQSALDLYRGLDVLPPDLEERTRHALIAAGRQADAKTSYAAAARHYAAATELMPGGDPERPAILQARALALFRLADAETPGALETAYDAQIQVGNLSAAAEAAEALGDWYMEANTPEPAEPWWAKAEDSAHRSGHLRVLLQVAEGRITRLNDEFRSEEAAAASRDALSLARSGGDKESLGLILRQHGEVRVWAGDPAGVEDIREAITLLEEAGSRWMVWAYTDLAQNAGFALTQLTIGRQAAEQALAAAHRFGETLMIKDAELRLALFNYYAGEWSAAEAIVDRYLDSQGRGRWFPLWIRGMMSIARGDEPTSEAMAIAIFEEDRSSGLLLQATAADSRGDKALTEALAGEALDLLEHEPRFGSFSAHLLPLAASDARLARITAQSPDADGAKPALIAGCDGRTEEAANLLASAGLLPLAARMRLLAAEAAKADGRPVDATGQAERALAFFTSVGASGYADKAVELLKTVH